MALPCAINSQWSHVAELRPVAAAGYDSCGGFTGSASLTIDLDGFPRRTRTASKADGLFKQEGGRWQAHARLREPVSAAHRSSRFSVCSLFGGRCWPCFNPLWPKSNFRSGYFG
jgi:hypothetical protein